MMKTLSLHMQANNGVSTNMQNQSIKSIRCTFCEISIESYSTSTEAPFEKTIIINDYFYYYDKSTMKCMPALFWTGAT
jgi:hypothetical protein